VDKALEQNVLPQKNNQDQAYTMVYPALRIYYVVLLEERRNVGGKLYMGNLDRINLLQHIDINVRIFICISFNGTFLVT
jgi:hypothetical protein